MATTKKKHIKLKLLPFIVLILVVGIVILGIYFFMLISIKNIYISGNRYFSDQEIIELAGIEDYPSSLKNSSSIISSRLKKNVYIKNVKVKKKNIKEVYIEVEEENRLFRKEENGLIVLENMEEVDDQKQNELPILLNYVPDTKYDSFIKGMNQVKEDIKVQISEIRYYPNEQDEDRFLLYMNDGNYVYLTLTKFKQINYYEEVLEKLDGEKGILYLDSGNHFQVME